MDPTTVNTIVGIVGILSTIIGIIIGIIGAINIHNSKNIVKNMSIKNNAGNVQQIGQINNTGPSVEDIEYLARKTGREHLKMVTKIEDIDELIKSNPRYCIPLVWSGTQEEYDELKNKGECHPSDYLNPICSDYLNPILSTNKLLFIINDACAAKYQSHTQTG